MNKTNLINSIAAKSGLNKKNSEAALDAFIEKALKNGEKAVIVGFGTFEVRTRESGNGKNSQTKEEIEIPETKAPVFKIGKALKDSVNN